MWLPKDQKLLLLFYYNKLGDQCVKGLDLDKSILSETIKLLNPHPTEKINNENELQIMDNPIYEKAKNAQGHLEAKRLIQLINSDTGKTHIRTYPKDKIIYKMKEVYLTTEGCDWARKYSNLFTRLGLWWEEYSPHPIWIIVGFIFVAILSPLIVNNITQNITKNEQNTKQEIRTYLESLSPEITKRIDENVNEIGVWLGPVNQGKLDSFSNRPEFNKYLSYTKTKQIWIVTGEGQKGEFIRPKEESGTLIGFILYPKDALKK